MPPWLLPPGELPPAIPPDGAPPAGQADPARAVDEAPSAVEPAGGDAELRRRLGRPTAGPGAAGQEEAPEDARTLWVDFDAHGKRHTHWRDVCEESHVEK